MNQSSMSTRTERCSYTLNSNQKRIYFCEAEFFLTTEPKYIDQIQINFKVDES